MFKCFSFILFVLFTNVKSFSVRATLIGFSVAFERNSPKALFVCLTISSLTFSFDKVLFQSYGLDAQERTIDSVLNTDLTNLTYNLLRYEQVKRLNLKTWR